MELSWLFFFPLLDLTLHTLELPLIPIIRFTPPFCFGLDQQATRTSQLSLRELYAIQQYHFPHFLHFLHFLSHSPSKHANPSITDQSCSPKDIGVKTLKATPFNLTYARLQPVGLEPSRRGPAAIIMQRLHEILCNITSSCRHL